MTKVTLDYDLSRPLAEDDFPNIVTLHSVYGIVRVQPDASLDRITVDYDASRMMKKDVESTLARFGVPVKAA